MKYSPDQIIDFCHQFIKLFALFQERNIVHRDIKPHNFILFGYGLECKLSDFGICIQADQRGNSVAGSFSYFSP